MPVSVPVDQLGAELKRVRKRRGLSLREVAEQTSISASTLSRLERGSSPDFENLDRLAEWLDVTVATRAGRGGQPKTDEDVSRVVAVHLRANKQLSSAAAEAIAEVVRMLLASAKAGK